MSAPPARAISHSPERSDWAARWTATSELEHAVCTVMLGPFSPSLYETRVAAESALLSEPRDMPVVLRALSPSASTSRPPYALVPTEPKTPTSGREPGMCPEFSRAACAVSRKSRIWGSAICASRGENPKRPASNESRSEAWAVART